jgi:hypothetical protein
MMIDDGDNDEDDDDDEEEEEGRRRVCVCVCVLRASCVNSVRVSSLGKEQDEGKRRRLLKTVDERSEGDTKRASINLRASRSTEHRYAQQGKTAKAAHKPKND